MNVQAERAAQEKRHKDAAAAWTKSLAADPNQPDVLRGLAQNLLSSAAGNDPKAALPYAQRLVELGPTWDTFDLRGRVYAALKDHRPALPGAAGSQRSDPVSLFNSITSWLGTPPAPPPAAPPWACSNSNTAPPRRPRCTSTSATGSRAANSALRRRN